jgi:heme exporter protein B
MSGPGFFRASWIVASKDLRLEWRTFETLSSSLVFSLIVLVIFSFGFSFDTLADLGAARLVPGVIWTVLAFASVVGVSRSMLLERQQETLSAIFLAPIDRSALFMGKAVANTVKVTVLQWVVLPLAAILFNFDLLPVAATLMLVLFLHGLGLTLLGTLFAAIASRVGRGDALVATLLFPAVSPIFISAVRCTTALLEGKELSSVSHWLLVAGGFDVLYLLLALSVFEFVLEE